MKLIMKKNILMAAGIAALFAGYKPADAGAANLYVAMGTRGAPEIVIGIRPDFIFLPDTGFYVSLGSPYDIIFYDNVYYLYQNGMWYYAWYYDGPWQHIPDYDLPPVLRRHQWYDLRRYRDREYRRHDRGYWNNQFQQDRQRFGGHPRNMPGGPPPPPHSPNGWHPNGSNGPGGYPPPPPPNAQGGGGWNNNQGGQGGHGGPPPPPSSPGGWHPNGSNGPGGNPPPPPPPSGPQNGNHSNGPHDNGRPDDGKPPSGGNQGGHGGGWPK
jgi:hypothetical protein